MQNPTHPRRLVPALALGIGHALTPIAAFASSASPVATKTITTTVPTPTTVKTTTPTTVKTTTPTTVKTTTIKTTTPTTTKKVKNYRVVSGTFKTKAEATAQLAKITKAGIKGLTMDTRTKTGGTTRYVVEEIKMKKQDAKTLVAALKKAGFKAEMNAS